jgi:MFS family permease
MSTTVIYPRFRWFVLLTLFIVTVAQSIVLISPAPLIGIISKTLGISLGETTGITMGTFTFFVAISAIIGGAIIDRIGVIRVFLGSLCLLIIGSLLVPVIGASVGGMIALRIIEGCGAGPIMAAVSAVAAQWFPAQERSIVTGVQGMSFGLGIALGFIAAPAIFEGTGNWQTAMAGMSVVSIVGLILSLFVVFGPKAPVVNSLEICDVSSGNASEFKLALGQIATWSGILCIFLFSWLNQAFNDITPGYLAIESPVGLGLGPMEAGKIMMIYQIAFMVGAVVSGIVTEKLFGGRAKPVVLISFLVTAVFTFSVKLPAVYSNQSTLLTCLIIAGFFMAWVNPQVMAFVAKNYPEQITGKVGGLILGIGIFGGTAGVAAGSTALHTTGFYLVSITIVSVVAIVGGIVTLGLNPPKAFCAVDEKISTQG